MEDAAADGCRCKHAFDERLEFDVAVIKGSGDRARELNLVCLEAMGSQLTGVGRKMGV